jgi:hypothetical protein
LPPLQLTSDPLIEMEGAPASLTVAVPVSEQLFASVTVTVYAPAKRPFAVAEDAPLDQL